MLSIEGMRYGGGANGWLSHQLGFPIRLDLVAMELGESGGGAGGGQQGARAILVHVPGRTRCTRIVGMPVMVVALKTVNHGRKPLPLN